ncbi:hypothetical protein FHX41_5104 [Actinomadura hallensis]|uniref:Uncharacterized protein n=1 Tax=Actinomadura hallensis TaxID=337895 RepID=A0A543ILC2_9ACTN|nr:hypothetical protein FHX41_5104 [Actinomadura hallensis]
MAAPRVRRTPFASSVAPEALFQSAAPSDRRTLMARALSRGDTGEL